MRTFLLSFVLLALIPSIVYGQSGEDDMPLIPADGIDLSHWEVHLGGTAIHVSEQNGWGFGLTGLAYYKFGDALGLELGATTILRSDGFYRFSGLSADLGVVYSPWYSESDPFEVDFSAGPSVLAGSDSDGTFLAFGGGYLGARVSYWPERSWHPQAGMRFGLFARGSLRIWNTGDLGPAATAGIAIRL